MVARRIDPYIKWAVYEVDTGTGAIIIEEHEADQASFDQRSYTFGLDCEMHNGQTPGDPWHVVSGQLYAPPVGG